MAAVFFIHGKQLEQEQRGELALHAMAARGDAKVVNRMIAGKAGKE